MNRILLIDDDVGLSELLTQLLEMEGFTVSQAYDGQEGLDKATQTNYDLILLDVMLPKLGGFEVLKGIRKRKQTPVLMLTARGDEIDRVIGLEIGADDYLPKPFNDRELIARIRAILRRATPVETQQSPQDILKVADLTIDATRQEVYCNDQLVILTSTEFSLLFNMLSTPGELVTKESLSESVLGKKLMPFDRSLDMHLSNLRKKLPERADGRARVKTLRGKGYIWIP
ncbi:response regulator [Shewanella gaetbuli]|uniref:Response regulator n=1 Tax=Shewanella gaetbuli TaxID=220752 RepID=A0A9X1ZJF2_9GAMM|nr:response regulator [Shewanella gaetbuli]MCL1142868.1 response regulator [Shewanella gaetbuli]